MAQTMEKRILDCEWTILRALWGRSPQSMGEIIASVRREHPEIQWKYKTYHSYLRVMLEKELIGCDVLNVKEKRYYSLVSEEEALSQESESLLIRISERSLGRMMAMMAERGRLTEKDRQDLMKLFERLSQEGGERHDG
jgi:BlaI family transcriptional regulator, penicillinase repressor